MTLPPERHIQESNRIESNRIVSQDSLDVDGESDGLSGAVIQCASGCCAYNRWAGDETIAPRGVLLTRGK